jgi:hypothetical protein
VYREREKEREKEGETGSEGEIDSAILRHKSLRPCMKKVPERETESRDPY